MGTEINAWGGKIRWREGETFSERVDILDATLFSVFFPTADKPEGPLEIWASINKEGDFLGQIETEANAPITLAPTAVLWTSLDASLAEVMAHSHIYFVAVTPVGADYEARYHAKRV